MVISNIVIIRYLEWLWECAT